MQINAAIVSVFSKNNFTGNLAGVCFLDDWIDNTKLQEIAAEVNLSETAFVVQKGDNIVIKYFSPKSEVLMCGHATLAASYLLFEKLKSTTLHLTTGEGKKLNLKKTDGNILLDLPRENYKRTTIENLKEIIGFNSEDVYISEINNDLFVVLNNVNLAEVQINQNALSALAYRGLIISTKSISDIYDFEVRYFAPRLGIDEDPVTGSIYGVLCEYWAKKLNKNKFCSFHASQEKGVVESYINENNITITGEINILSNQTISLKA